MEEARQWLSKPNPVISKAKAALDSGIELVSNRNKLIVLADSSDGGWQTVEEYTQRDIAADSDDDRRIRKAEFAAIRKLQQRRRGGFRGRFRGGSFRNFNSPPQYFNQRYGGYRQANGPQPSDICFQCGEQGHWRRACMSKRSANSAAGGSAGTQ